MCLKTNHTPKITINKKKHSCVVVFIADEIIYVHHTCTINFYFVMNISLINGKIIT